MQFCVFSNLVLWNLFYHQALRRAQICLTVHQIIGNSTERIAINLARKIPILSHKYCIELNFFITPFQITIVRSYRAAMFVLHVDSLKARALFVPKSRAILKPYGASLNTLASRHLKMYREQIKWRAWFIMV